ncbi:hypothetical protein DY000_02061505 [Brassica cretica]|uniref:Uncharacterized protein n=1 Tax=Brassica cretica TaxID=69181 RepID=A0ABQ7ANL0_BRACR|nr:hypothetical protein DY000_02061505 [Brassica cretica]
MGLCFPYTGGGSGCCQLILFVGSYPPVVCPPLVLVALKRIKGRMRFSDSSQGAVLYPRSSLSGSGGEETWWGIRPSQCSGGRLVIETGFFSRFLQVRMLSLPVILSPQPVFWVASELNDSGESKFVEIVKNQLFRRWHEKYRQPEEMR